MPVHKYRRYPYGPALPDRSWPQATLDGKWRRNVATSEAIASISGSKALVQ